MSFAYVLVTPNKWYLSTRVVFHYHSQNNVFVFYQCYISFLILLERGSRVSAREEQNDEARWAESGRNVRAEP